MMENKDRINFTKYCFQLTVLLALGCIITYEHAKVQSLDNKFVLMKTELTTQQQRMLIVEDRITICQDLYKKEVKKSNQKEVLRMKRHVMTGGEPVKGTWPYAYLIKQSELLNHNRTVMYIPVLKGEKGESGQRGEQGESGQHGKKGEPGQRGKKGPRGYRGKSGPMGPKGEKGDQGLNGYQGLKGDTGKVGLPGPKGPQGQAGVKGDNGKSISKPIITPKPASQTVMEHGELTMTCEANGNPIPKIEWYHNGRPVDNGRYRIHGKMGISLNNITFADRGNMTCDASNILGKTKATAEIIVWVKPTVLLPRPIFSKEYVDVSIKCTATGFPNPNITWERVGDRIPRNIEYRSAMSVIVLKRAREDNSGIYKCMAKSVAGSAEGQTVLVIKDIDECSSSPCQNNGKCNDQVDGYHCTCMDGYSGVHCENNIIRRDCAEICKEGVNPSGVYMISPDKITEFEVYCDMETAGGGWTVFQKRRDSSVNFYRSWNEYKQGFGSVKKTFWLGNDKLHLLTHISGRPQTLRADLWDKNGNAKYAQYGTFQTDTEANLYRLTVGSYSGNAGDSIMSHNGKAFTTKDRDNDVWANNCAVQYKGGWWYTSCYGVNLNGIDLYWNRANLHTEMKLRPITFSGCKS